MSRTGKWLLLFLPMTFAGCSPKAVAPPAAIPGDAESTPEAVSPEIIFTHTIRSEAAYYIGGPQQARPADGTFAAGTKVRIVEDAGSYVVVESEQRVTAYVASDAIEKIAAAGEE